MFTAPPKLQAEQFSIVPPFITKEPFPLDKDRTGIVIRSASADGAAVHNKSATRTDIHRATVIIGFAIRNSAAAHHKFAVDSFGIPG
ncbi:MAG: hypothetical protein ACLTS1_18110 [Coprococcus sp.]